LPGLHKVRTMFSANKRSRPRVESSAYLELYMLNKEKERLLKEDERLSRRKDAIKKRLEEINSEINKLQETEAAVKAVGDTNSSGATFTQKEGVKKKWKKMSLNY